MNTIISPELYTNKPEYAYDYNGEKWQVEAIASSDGNAIDGCTSLENLLREYDMSGAMRDCLNDDYEDTENLIIVGARSDEYGRAAWVWDFDGICYDNK